MREKYYLIYNGLAVTESIATVEIVEMCYK